MSKRWSQFGFIHLRWKSLDLAANSITDCYIQYGAFNICTADMHYLQGQWFWRKKRIEPWGNACIHSVASSKAHLLYLSDDFLVSHVKEWNAGCTDFYDCKSSPEIIVFTMFWLIISWPKQIISTHMSAYKHKGVCMFVPLFYCNLSYVNKKVPGCGVEVR